MTTVLRHIHLADGSEHDLTLADGLVARLDRAGSANAPVGADVRRLDGWLVVPSLVEPHAHLDKALTATRVPNASGDLGGAIDAWIAARQCFDVEELRTRAVRTLALYAGHGTTTIRTHVDTGPDVAKEAVGVLVGLRAELAGVMDLQVYAGHGLPVTGPGSIETRAAAREALAMGADGLGGAPCLDARPIDAFEALVELAEEADVPLDLHIDETLDPTHLLLEHIAARSKPRVPLAVDHVCSLSAQPEQVRLSIATRLASKGVGVVTLPQSNLYLQGREHGPNRPRGLTAVADLLAAGVNVAGGSDNVGDPFNPMGRADPLETASLLVTAGHLSPLQALDAVTRAARQFVGMAPTSVAPGQPADLLAAPAADVADLLGRAPADRLVFRAGRVVAQTHTSRTWAGDRRITIQ
ncbi:amidohydrolase family protein [Xylanimonas ulmi]|uniref:Cytosine deaminase n=1 Tax=Xylanimonas ulmi TaxID=228973 RepID=A0A4Q7M2N7_9MICO|nr:amidohydrolase family protein [Xylanibacterium ulmi]RZS60728.1 cytosine deaminase [Xylanibacterium ulmi]